MKFKNEQDKRKFIETAVNKGFEAAKSEYLKNNKTVLTVTKDDPFGEVFGQTMHVKDIQKKYPEILIVEANSEKTKEIIDEL